MKLGKYSFNKGDKIVIPYCAQFVNEDLFPWGEEFKPEKLLASSKDVPQMALIPFSAGRRGCLGRVLAETIIKVGMIELLSRYSLSIPEGDVNGWVLGIGFMIKHGNVFCESLPV